MSFRGPKLRFPKPEHSFPPPENAFGDTETPPRLAKTRFLNDLPMVLASATPTNYPGGVLGGTRDWVPIPPKSRCPAATPRTQACTDQCLIENSRRAYDTNAQIEKLFVLRAER
jgi:hypothetical protein